MVSELDDTNIMLCDFGFAKHISDLQGDRTLCGTPDYVAPEILMRKPYGSSVDVWSAGVITYSLLGGYPPFYDESEDQNKLFRKIIKGAFVFDAPFWDPISADAKDLVQQMLTLDPNERPSAADLLRHPWVMDASKAASGASEADMTGAVERLKQWQARRRLKGAMKTVRAITRLQKITGGLKSPFSLKKYAASPPWQDSPSATATAHIRIETNIATVNEESASVKAAAAPGADADGVSVASSTSSEPPPPPSLKGSQTMAFVAPAASRSPKRTPKQRFTGVLGSAATRLRRPSVGQETVERVGDSDQAVGDGGVQKSNIKKEEEKKIVKEEETEDESENDEASDDERNAAIGVDGLAAPSSPASKKRGSLLSKLVGSRGPKLTAEQRQQHKLEGQQQKTSMAAQKKVSIQESSTHAPCFDCLYCLYVRCVACAHRRRKQRSSKRRNSKSELSPSKKLTKSS